MIRFCPNCHTERPLTEIFCEGEIDGLPCGWNLSAEPIRPEGWRPQPVVTQDALEEHTGEAAPAPAPGPVCENGHPMEPGDLMCHICGAGPAQTENVPADDHPQTTETVIDGWRLLRQIGNPAGRRECYQTEHIESGRRAVLTLYQVGAEPDPAVYDSLRNISHQHVAEILANGRWNERAYEVAEKLSGQTLADLGIAPSDDSLIESVLREVGQALDAFNDAGLRHRDLRPANLLVRSREPLDIVIGGFGSARLSEYDLEIVSPLETSVYMAPEAVAGGVAAASDWWSLGMILLELLTGGACFRGINPGAFLIHVLAEGVPLPDDLTPRHKLLLRGLLARDRLRRWQWREVSDWLAGLHVDAPDAPTNEDEHAEGASIALDGSRYRKPAVFALAAAHAENWAQALALLLRGEIVTWAEQAGLPPQTLSSLHRIAQHEALEDDFRLTLSLKLLNPQMPLIHRGEIITPGWLLEHPVEGYSLITGVVPHLLEQMQTENWLARLKKRAEAVRQRAQLQDIALDEEQLHIYLLSTSRASLAAQWQERQHLLPDSGHPGLQALMGRRVIAEEDLIVLLSAAIGQFRSVDSIVEEATRLARESDVLMFDSTEARRLLQSSRQDLFRAVDERISGFARCNVPAIDEWAEQFRLERRMTLARVVILLAIPPEQWLEPKKQQYVSQILDFFGKKVGVAVMRGPLVRMGIGKNSARIDLCELSTERRPAAALLEHLLQRHARQVSLDPERFVTDPALLRRLTILYRQSSLYKRDTGVDGLYLGFPFLLHRDPRANVRTRIAPVLLWPVRLQMEVGSRGQVTLAFDGEREEVRLNPAMETLLGADACKRWKETADELLGHSALHSTDVIDAFGMLAATRSRNLEGLPPLNVEVAAGQYELACAAVLFHVTFIGQAIGEDLRQLKNLSPTGTGLETALRLRKDGDERAIEAPPETARFHTAATDPSQEAAVLRARQAPGVLVEGPPGTGKSQTIVNMVGDAIGNGRSLLIVCQKRAALDVVYKRLLAEGLEQRIVMLTDVNRDRERVIRVIREQLDTLFADRSGTPGWMHKREQVAARIEALEGKLDRSHRSLHEIDDATGLSYRQVLSDLIDIESHGAIIELPALRQRLTKLDATTVARLEENCAPLAGLWLPARFEGSPLAQLKAFTPDDASLQSFNESLARFIEAEAQRDDVLDKCPASFEVEDPAPYREWMTAYLPALLDLADTQRNRLAAWLPLFRHAAAGKPSQGAQLLSRLEEVARASEVLDSSHYDVLLSPVLNTLTERQLARIRRSARKVLNASSSLARINPLHHWRLHRLRAFLARTGDADDARIAALLRAADLEARWRPMRAELASCHRLLTLDRDCAQAGLELPQIARDSIRSLHEVQALADALALSPRAKWLDAAVLTGERQTLQARADEMSAALARQNARQRSAECLNGLSDWMGDVLHEEMQGAIAHNRSNKTSLDALNAALPSLAAYQRFRPHADQLSKAELGVFALLREREDELARVASIELETFVRRLLAREARLGWKQRMEHAHPELLLGRDDARTRIASLAEADTQMRQLNRQMLAQGVDMQRLGTRKQWEEVTRLTGKRSRRLREFIEMGAQIGLMSLRPVWLMNPDVASRVLPLKPGLFDTVIYDEASQMPVEYALPTLFRARVTVVSGDEKQMPPTSFFSSRVENDEAETIDADLPGDDIDEEVQDTLDDNWNRREIKDCPDLLQLARAVLPGATLEIHYRSAFRELIAYSNAAFYGNRLNVPVRHPQANIARIKPVELIQVGGIYREQSNEEEAEHVVDYLARMWAAPRENRPSVGVVSFNRKQADLIEERLALRAEQDAAFRQAYTEERERYDHGEDMSVFVKNVENVQGDERDVIVFSSTFGRNAQGSFRRNFGVLGQAGGERRLNVAVTRARRKVAMITSMPIADISDMLATRRAPAGPRDHLQGYFEYARALTAGEFAVSESLLGRVCTSGSSAQQRVHTQDGFMAAVAAYIRSLGYDPVPANGDDAFALDFAIENPATGLYAIGIECDTPRHPLLAQARAREIWRPSVLRRAIPCVHRVSALGWYGDAEQERKFLREAIEQALDGVGIEAKQTAENTT